MKKQNARPCREQIESRAWASWISREPARTGLQEPQELSGSKHDPNDWRSTCCACGPGATQHALYNIGSPPYSRHDPEAAPYIKPKLNNAPYNLGSQHDSRGTTPRPRSQPRQPARQPARPRGHALNKPIIGLY